MTTMNRTARLTMLALSAAALVLALTPAAANAKPKGSGSGTCSCLCDGGPNGSSVTSYDAVAGASCDAFNGETCTFQTKDQLVRQGTLSVCQAGDGSPVTGKTSNPNMSMAPPKSNGPPPKTSGGPEHPDAATGSAAKAP